MFRKSRQYGEDGGRHPPDQAVLRGQGTAPRGAAAVPRGGLLRDLLGRRRDGVPGAGPRADEEIQRRQGAHPHGRLPAPRHRELPDETGPRRLQGGHLRPAGGPEVREETRQARGDGNRHAGHLLRREHAGNQGEQLPVRPRLRARPVRRRLPGRVHRTVPGGAGLAGLHRHADGLALPQGAGRSPELREGRQGPLRRLLHDVPGRMGLRV